MFWGLTKRKTQTHTLSGGLGVSIVGFGDYGRSLGLQGLGFAALGPGIAKL